jgi:hypothetical protein
MFKDLQTSSTTGCLYYASLDETIRLVLAFVDLTLPDFISFYHAQGSPQRENRISDLMVAHFHYCNDGAWPFFFQKNPTQLTGGRETDIGVFSNDRKTTPLLPIFEFEAKKLSRSSTNHEYVYGERGGMERFKREIHSPHLPQCGMLGYVLCKDLNHWSNQINTWITSLANQFPREGIDWQGKDELLHFLGTNDTIAKFVSKNKRVTLSDITILHYLIDLQ